MRMMGKGWALRIPRDINLTLRAERGKSPVPGSVYLGLRSALTKNMLLNIMKSELCVLSNTLTQVIYHV